MGKVTRSYARTVSVAVDLPSDVVQTWQSRRELLHYLHVRGGPALLPGDGRRRRRGHRPPGARPSRRQRPRLPRAAQRDRRRRAGLAARAAVAAHPLRGLRAGGLADRLPRAVPQVRPLRDQRVPRGRRAPRPAARPRAQPRRGLRAARAAHRLPLPARRGAPRPPAPTPAGAPGRPGPLPGSRPLPAAGLVPLREFSGSLRDRLFHSTQYVRHAAVPLYTPEPDIIHEVIGHGHLLATPTFSELHRATGEATHRLRDEDNLRFLSNVFWFSVEFGVVVEDGELRAYGAGILSSYGEIEEFRDMEHRPLDLVEMGTTDYDITAYQPVLYRAESLDEVREVVGGFLRTCTDESIAELRARARVTA